MAQNNNEGRGFGGMDSEKQKEIAGKGGKSQEKGAGREFDSRETREAGRKGGEAVGEDREHMAEIGKKGGEATSGNQGRNQGGNQGNASNLSQEDRAKGGRNSGGGR